jgi:hypothetical protein
MIFHRASARLREENWVAITIDFVIVVIGVFLGIQASNWNQARLEQRQVNELLMEMRPELSRMRQADAMRLNYYNLTGDYARTALAGWANNSTINDTEFVIAAYQASQITGQRGESQLRSILSSEDIRNVDDPMLRWALLRLMNFNYDAVSASAMQTRYREDVRQIIPEEIQEAIRRTCGDRALPNGIPILPSTCNVRIATVAASAAADDLRRHPELASELRFHVSQAANFETNTVWLDDLVARLQRLLDAKFGQEPPAAQ